MAKDTNGCLPVFMLQYQMSGDAIIQCILARFCAPLHYAYQQPQIHQEEWVCGLVPLLVMYLKQGQI